MYWLYEILREGTYLFAGLVLIIGFACLVLSLQGDIDQWRFADLASWSRQQVRVAATRIDARKAVGERRV